MKLELARVSLATPGARDARRSWPQRHSVLLRITADTGHVGLGEASPLPDYGLETLEASEAALASLDEAQLQTLLALPPLGALAAAHASLPRATPAARMALETALLDLLARQAGVSAPTLLGASPDGARPLAALLGPATAPDLFERAHRALSEGFLHLKLKLGEPGQLARELSALRALRERIGSAPRLRLDANGALSQAELEQAWPAVERLDIELFEEPCAAPGALPASLPLALDESLQAATEDDVAKALRERRPHCLVLKPMLLGGLEHCARLARLALEAQPPCAFALSHAFDGPLAWRAAAALALALPPSLAHGLGPHAGLSGYPAHALPLARGLVCNWSEPGLGVSESVWPA